MSGKRSFSPQSEFNISRICVFWGHWFPSGEPQSMSAKHALLSQTIQRILKKFNIFLVISTISRNNKYLLYNMWCCFLITNDVWCCETFVESSCLGNVSPQAEDPELFFSIRKAAALCCVGILKILAMIYSWDKLSWTLMTSFSTFQERTFALTSSKTVWKKSLVFATLIFLQLVSPYKWFIVFLTHPIKKQFISICSSRCFYHVQNLDVFPI